jgi:hypothetical protein
MAVLDFSASDNWGFELISAGHRKFRSAPSLEQSRISSDKRLDRRDAAAQVGGGDQQREVK